MLAFDREKRETLCLVKISRFTVDECSSKIHQGSDQGIGMWYGNKTACSYTTSDVKSLCEDIEDPYSLLNYCRDHSISKLMWSAMTVHVHGHTE